MFRQRNSRRGRTSLRFIKISVHRGHQPRLRQILRYALSMSVTKMPWGLRRVKTTWNDTSELTSARASCCIMSRATGILHSAHARIIARDSLFCVFRMRLKRPRNIRMGFSTCEAHEVRAYAPAPCVARRGGGLWLLIRVFIDRAREKRKNTMKRDHDYERAEVRGVNLFSSNGTRIIRIATRKLLINLRRWIALSTHTCGIAYAFPVLSTTNLCRYRWRNTI